MKEILENHGYEQSSTGSPKLILKTAYQAGLIDNEEVWINALFTRNNVAHSYNEDIALGIVKETKEQYMSTFTALKETVEKNWL